MQHQPSRAGGPGRAVNGENTFAASGASNELDTGTEYFLPVDLSAAGDKDFKARRTATSRRARSSDGWSRLRPPGG